MKQHAIPEGTPDLTGDGATLRFALAGQPNVGKSTVFNMLTGLNQHVGNWPGKTVPNVAADSAITMVCGWKP